MDQTLALPADARNADRTWSMLVAERDQRERDLMRALPYRIGITWRPDGGWHEYVRTPPMYDLPGHLAEAAPRPISADALDRFRHAHHCAGFYGLLIDRVADGQVVADAALRRDRRWLHRAWLDSLTAACGDRAVAERAVAWAIRRWRRGLAAEREAIEASAFSAVCYARTNAAKVSFLWVASEAMLRAHETPSRTIMHLQRIFERLMLALQCCDDANDDSEDESLRGAGMSRLLGATPATLRALGCGWMDRIAADALVPESLRAWCRYMRQRTCALIPGRESVVAALGAHYLARSIDLGGQ